MKLYLVIFALTIQTGAPYKRKPQCHACFDNICYSRSLIFHKHRISGQIAVERGGNIVHYHYTDSKNRDFTESFDLDDIRFLKVPGIDFSFARAVDQSTRDVYIGGGTGIFKYNPISNVNTTRVGLFDKTIWHMQYKDKIYYTEFMKKGLNTYSGKSKSIPALVDYKIEDFIIDKQDDIYFMSNLTMYKMKKDERPIVFSNIVYSLSTDINNSAYFAQSVNRGLYKIDYRTGNLTEVGAFSSGTPVKVVFDNFNNVIYYDSEAEKLFYLTPNYGRCRVRNEGRGNLMKKMVASFLDEPHTNLVGDTAKP